MNKGIIIGISIAIIIGVGVLIVSNNYSNEVNDISFTEVGETSLTEEVIPKPKQFTIGLEESVGFSGG